LAAILAFAGPGFAGGQKPVYLISCHEEGESLEPPRTIQEFEINGEKRHFRKMPVLTQRNFKAYWPFPAEDGKSWGAVFWLDSPGQHVVERLGHANRGQFLAIAINRMPVDVQLIDTAPSDGRLVIWKGIPAELFPIIDKEKRIRRIGPAPGADRSAVAGRRGTRTTAAPREPRTTPVDNVPLPENAVVGPIDRATLDSAHRDLRPPASPARRSARPRPPADAALPFPPDAELDRPDIVPLPEPDPKRR
jgi:hypothetical protein